MHFHGRTELLAPFFDLPPLFTLSAVGVAVVVAVVVVAVVYLCCYLCCVLCCALCSALMDAYIDSIARGETDVNPSRQLSICEYVRERDGETRNIFQLFCECNQVDATLENFVTNGKVPTSSTLQHIENDISDRIRVPWLGGAVKINLWFFIMPLLLTLEGWCAASFTAPRTVSFLFNAVVCWHSIRVMNTAETARSHMHLQFTGWSIGQVIHQCYTTLSQAQVYRWQDGVGVFVAASAFLSYCYLRNSDPGVLSSMAPPLQSNKRALAAHYVQHSTHRAKYCQISHSGVARYDHFCIWVGRPIGKYNHKWFLLFCASVCVGGGLFWWTVGGGGDGGSGGGGGNGSGSTYGDVVATRCLMACMGTCGLLLRQTWLISNGLTSYENLHCVALKEAGWKHTQRTGWQQVLCDGAKIKETK